MSRTTKSLKPPTRPLRVWDCEARTLQTCQPPRQHLRSTTSSSLHPIRAVVLAVVSVSMTTQLIFLQTSRQMDSNSRSSIVKVAVAVVTLPGAALRTMAHSAMAPATAAAVAGVYSSGVLAKRGSVMSIPWSPSVLKRKCHYIRAWAW